MALSQLFRVLLNVGEDALDPRQQDVRGVGRPRSGLRGADWRLAPRRSDARNKRAQCVICRPELRGSQRPRVGRAGLRGDQRGVEATKELLCRNLEIGEPLVNGARTALQLLRFSPSAQRTSVQPRAREGAGAKRPRLNAIVGCNARLGGRR